MHPARSTRRTTIFAKRPRPGEVKTRLAPPLSLEEAAELAEAMLADTLDKCLACGEFDTALCVAPAAEVAWFRARFPAVLDVTGQTGADLAERMALYFEHAARARERRTDVLVGSDAPHVPVATIAAAHAALERGRDLVLGPDDGGGYYLVGLREPHPELFVRVEMSTRNVCTQTLAVARQLGLEVELLPACFDLDLPSDLERLTLECASESSPFLRPARTLAVLARVAGPLAVKERSTS